MKEQHPCKVRRILILSRVSSHILQLNISTCLVLFSYVELIFQHLLLLKVTAVSTSKTGKHGHAKCNFTAIDIFTGKKYEDIIPSTHTAHVPNVKRVEYSLLDITEDGFVSLMDADGNVRDDVKLPEWPDNFAREIKAAFETEKPQSVTVVSAMGHDQITTIKEEADATKA